MSNNHSHQDPASDWSIFATRVQQITDLLQGMRAELAANTFQAPTAQQGPAPAATVVQQLLDTRGSLIVADVVRELGASPQNAARLLRLVAHDGGGILMYEPHGHVDRLRLYRPDKVIVEH